MTIGFSMWKYDAADNRLYLDEALAAEQMRFLMRINIYTVIIMGVAIIGTAALFLCWWLQT